MTNFQEKVQDYIQTKNELDTVKDELKQEKLGHEKWHELEKLKKEVKDITELINAHTHEIQQKKKGLSERLELLAEIIKVYR